MKSITLRSTYRSSAAAWNEARSIARRRIRFRIRFRLAIQPAISCRRLWACSLPCRFRRSEEHTSELQSHLNLVCRLLLEKKNKTKQSRGILLKIYKFQSSTSFEQRQHSSARRQHIDGTPLPREAAAQQICNLTLRLHRQQ